MIRDIYTDMTNVRVLKNVIPETDIISSAGKNT